MNAAGVCVGVMSAQQRGSGSSLEKEAPPLGSEGAAGMSQARREVKRGWAERTTCARAGGKREYDVFENLLVEASLPVGCECEL